MPRDELRQPLRKRSLRERLWARRPRAFTVAAAAVLSMFLGGGAWLSRIPHPNAGEPVIVALIPPAQELTTASTQASEAAAQTREDASPEDASPEDVIQENAALAEAPEDLPDKPAARPDYQNEAMIITVRKRPLKPAPIASVTEKGAQGPLPRMSDRGKTPFDVYSQVTPLQVSASARPRIAILLGGMGLNARLTARASDQLPGDVSFGFAPYGDNLQKQVNAVRGDGHEVMLQVPMEPVGFPGNNPGPKTLLSDATEIENIDSLQWHMSRFAGYSGVMNYMGSRLLVTEAAIAPMMRELKKRGLVYLEDATVSLTFAAKIGQAANLPVRRADLVIDADATAPAIAAALQQLEEKAAANGYAIGTGSGLDVTIDTVAEWAKTLQDKGILLVPISASYRGRAS